MRWTERQRAMLRAMGVRLFEHQPGPEAALGVEVLEPASAPAPLRPTASPPPVRSPVAADKRVAPIAPIAVLPAILPAIHPATGSAASTLDWHGLQGAVSACRACPLGLSRRQAVFGAGHAHAHWMIVGEAPGEQEDAVGEPFVGPSGQLLDNMLRALGLTRADAPPERQVFITNTLKCRPPKNRNPDPAETAQCAPFLLRQIALVQPRILLAMGRFAAQALLGSDEPVGKLRGRVHRVAGVPVVVTYHPSYLLRTPADKARAWDDLCLAADVVDAADKQSGHAPA